MMMMMIRKGIRGIPGKGKEVAQFGGREESCLLVTALHPVTCHA